MNQKSLAVAACLSGCYFQYPHDLKRSAPLPGSRIEFHDTDHVEYFHDCDHHASSCVYHNHELVRPHHYTETSAELDGKQITRGQVSTLVEPDRQAKAYAEMERHKSTCALSLVPSVVFAAGALADLGGFAAYEATSSTAAEYVLIGGAIAMVAGAALSYPLGGFACNAGRDSSQHTGIWRDNEIVWITGEDDSGAIAREEELRTAVASFNEHGGKTPPKDEPDTTASGSGAGTVPDAPVAQPTTVSGNLHDALAGDARFSTFVKLADAAGLDELASDNHFTIFAPTDNTFAGAPDFDLDKVLADNSKRARRKLREMMQSFVVQKVEPLDDTVKRGFTSNRAGSHIAFKRDGKVITADGFVVIDAPINAANGVIYPLGPRR